MSDELRALRRDLAETKQLARQAATVATTLADKVQALADALTAVNAKTQRAGVSLPTLAAGVTDVTITWPNPWPDTAYGVWISILAGGGTAPLLHCTLKNGTKTTDDCVVTVINSTGGVVATGIDVLGVRT